MALSVFIDTGAWVGLFSPRDQHHPAAIRAFEELEREQRLLIGKGLGLPAPPFQTVRARLRHTAYRESMRTGHSRLQDIGSCLANGAVPAGTPP